MEHKLRHRTLVTGASPFICVHGFFGSSSLSTALGAITEIPEDTIWQDWIQDIVSESKKISAMVFEHYATEAAVRARKNS